MSRIESTLGGAWRLVLDPENTGESRNWPAGDVLPDGLDAEVPSVWQVWAPDHFGAAWYFRRFTLGDEWSGRNAQLSFEGAFYFTKAWLNGVFLGSHEGGFTPFAFDATNAVRPGENTLAVRVVAPGDTKDCDGFVAAEIPRGPARGSAAFGGLWGEVRLLGQSEAHITDVFIEPDPRREQLRATVSCTDTCGEVRIAIEGTGYAATGKPGPLTLGFPGFTPWSPETPQLYNLRVELAEGGTVLDSTSVRFGMRDFTVRDGRFRLNNHPIFIKGVIHDPVYARSLAAPANLETARAELRYAKEAGFNLVRVRNRPAPKVTLDIADELGMLVYEEPPLARVEKTPALRDHCAREVREMVLRDRNHPSVVAWGLLAEAGPASLYREELRELVRSLDPGRLVIDVSGSMASERTPTTACMPYSGEHVAVADLQSFCHPPITRETEMYLSRNGDPDQPCWVSAFGAGAMEDVRAACDRHGGEKRNETAPLLEMLDAAEAGFQARELERAFGDFSGFMNMTQGVQCDAALHQIDALRANGKVAGYCLDRLADGGDEFSAGILDRRRRPKAVIETLKRMQTPLRPIIDAPRTNLGPRSEVPITVTMQNDLQHEGRADMSLQVVGPTNQILWKKKRGVRVPRHGRELWTGKVSVSGSEGPHKFVVRLMDRMKVLGEASLVLQSVRPAEPTGVEVHVLDPDAEWQTRVSALATPGTVQAPLHIVPPLANTVRAYPDNDLAQVLAQARGGAVAIVFGPPDDWNELADAMGEPAIEATSVPFGGLAAYHYVKLHPVFNNLPSRCLMRQPYRNVAPQRMFLEMGDEDICGTFDSHAWRKGQPPDETPWWGSALLVRKYGSGRIVFCHLRVLENLGLDPLADLLFTNMVRHFSRRSFPSEGLTPLHQGSVEWMRRERNGRVRRWMIIGMFPNWGGKGHDTPYPPEEKVDFGETYPGWYRAVTWRPWFSSSEQGHSLDLDAALAPAGARAPGHDWGTAYAYAEFTFDRRGEVPFAIRVQDTARVWVNGVVSYASEEEGPRKHASRDEFAAHLRQGRNTLLVKASKFPGPCRFSLNFADDRDHSDVKWWR